MCAHIQGCLRQHLITEASIEVPSVLYWKSKKFTSVCGKHTTDFIIVGYQYGPLPPHMQKNNSMYYLCHKLFVTFVMGVLDMLPGMLSCIQQITSSCWCLVHVESSAKTVVNAHMRTGRTQVLPVSLLMLYT